MKSVKIISIILIIISISIMIFVRCEECYSIVYQNHIIDSMFSINDDSLGYICIPRLGIKRIIKYGTDSSILDDGFVGMHAFSDSLASSNLIVLAGHNIYSVFSKLHDIYIGDYVYIVDGSITRKFYVYDKKIVNEYDMSYFYNRSNELMLITCTDDAHYRLVVFLKEGL